VAKKTLRNFQVAGALFVSPGGAEIAAGDEVRLFLNQVANPAFPEYVDGIAQNPIARVNLVSGGCVVEGTSYTFEYEADDLDGAATVLNVCDVTDVSAIACCEVLRDALDDEIAARTSADTALQENIDAVQDDLDTWDVLEIAAEPVNGVTGRKQITTQTVIGTVTSGGTMTLTVTAAGLTGSPLAISFDVDSGDIPSAVAAKAAAALAGNAAVSALFEVDNIGADFALTRLVEAANDATLNLAIANNTATGVTPDAVSAATQSGLAAVTGTVAERIGQHAQWGNRVWEAIDTTPNTWVEVTTERNSVMQSYALFGLTGGGSGTRLDSLVVTAEDIGRVQLVNGTANFGHYTHVLEAGTDAENAPYIVRPDNYAASTNEVVWKWKPAITNSASIVDASGGGNGSADSSLVVTFGAGGGLSATDRINLQNVAGGPVAAIAATTLTATRTINLPDYSATLAPQAVLVAATPATGFTIAAGRYADEVHYLTPAGTLATGTFTLPTAANSRTGQLVRLWSTQIVTTLTVNVSGAGSILGTALTAAAANTPYAWQCVSTAGSGTWIRIQ
jgi:hypothetical protein